MRDAQVEAYAKTKNKNILRIEIKLKNPKKIKDIYTKLALFPEEIINKKNQIFIQHKYCSKSMSAFLRKNSK